MSGCFLSMMTHLMWVVFPNMLVVLSRCYVGCVTKGVCDLCVKIKRECCSLVDPSEQTH